MNQRRTLGLALSVALIAGGVAAASETEFWHTSTFDQFLEGQLQGVSLSREGELRLAPQAFPIFSPDETVALSVAADSNQTIYLGTGHQGKVFRVEGGKTGKLFFQAQEPEILAMAVGQDHAIYVGSSPQGKVYRVTPDGKSSVFFNPKARYIWALAFDPQGRLYVATGDRGEIFRVDATGKGSVFFESSQTHIMCLTWDRAGNLLAGSEPNGLIFRISPEGKGYVLYQANLPEIHALAVDDHGNIYAAALGGVAGKGVPGLFVPSTPGTLQAPVTTITVTAAGGSGAASNADANQPPSTAPTYAPPMNSPMGFGYQGRSPGRGALIQILPDYSAETLWTSNKESIFGLAIRGQDVVFSTDGDGHVFDLRTSANGPKLTLLTETREALPTRLLQHDHQLLVATSNIARLFRIGNALETTGNFVSPVKDTRFVSRWGVLAWRGSIPAGTSLEFFTRSGNSDRPDKTWSDWSGPYTKKDTNLITSTPARYIQWKAVLHGANGLSPTLEEVSVSYLNQNLPPQIQFLRVSTAGERTGLVGSTGNTGGMGTVSVTMTPGAFGAPTAGNAPMPKQPISLTWQAEDPNGDRLEYDLYLKAADEENWHLVKRNLHETNYTLNADSYADGQYQARLVASDQESNPPGEGRTADLVSVPFWIDNSPPVVQVVSQKEVNGGAEIHFTARSQVAPLRSAEISTNSRDWQQITSDDGIVDSQYEAFTVNVKALAPGEHVITLRAFDTAGNVGIGKAVVRVALAGSGH